MTGLQGSLRSALTKTATFNMKINPDKILQCRDILLECYKETQSFYIKIALVAIGNFAQQYSNQSTWGIRLDSIMIDPKDYKNK